MQDSNGNMYKKYQNATKKLTIYVSDEKISVNNKPATVTNFTDIIDKITADWTKEDMMNYSIHLRSDNGVDKFMGKLASAFHNTRLYKTNPSKELLPPPPPPAPIDPSEITPKNYKILEIKLEGKKAIYVKGQKTSLSDLKKAITENFPEWAKDDEKPRALTILQGSNTPDARGQQVFSVVQDFNINTLNIVKQGSNELQKPENQNQLPAPPPPPAPDLENQRFESVSTTAQNIKNIHLKIYDQKINLEGKEVELEDLTSTLNLITLNWNNAEFEQYGIGLMQYPSTTQDFKNKVEGEIKKSDIYKKTRRTFLSLPPAPQAPSTPPTPPSPEKMIAEMTAARADFYYNGDKVSAEKAKELFKNKDNLSFMSTKAKNGNKPMVLITDN